MAIVIRMVNAPLGLGGAVPAAHKPYNVAGAVNPSRHEKGPRFG